MHLFFLDYKNYIAKSSKKGINIWEEAHKEKLIKTKNENKEQEYSQRNEKVRGTYIYGFDVNWFQNIAPPDQPNTFCKRVT